jgi:hypothetical protein
VDTPKKDALLEMNWVSQLGKQWTSVKQTAMLTPLVFRWNGKTRTVALASCPTVVLMTFRLVVKRQTFTSKVTLVGGFTYVALRVVYARAIATTIGIVLAI